MNNRAIQSTLLQSYKNKNPLFQGDNESVSWVALKAITLEYDSRESDRNIPVTPIPSLKMKDKRTLGIAWAIWVPIVLQFHISFGTGILLQNVSGFLLQNVAVLLQNVTAIKK